MGTKGKSCLKKDTEVQLQVKEASTRESTIVSLAKLRRDPIGIKLAEKSHALSVRMSIIRMEIP